MLRLAAGVRDALIAHAHAEYPKEACGLLAGAGGVATHGYPMRNVDQSPISYTMDPQEQLQVMKRMRTEGVELLGIYHSHTASPAYPSPTDVRLAVYPEVSYVLVSLKDRAHPEVQSYRITDGRITPEPLELVAAPTQAP